MKRMCPLCSRRVRVLPERATPNATLPDAEVVWAWSDHGCELDGEPVDQAQPIEPPADQPPRRVGPGYRQRQVYDALAAGPATVAELSGRLDLSPAVLRHALYRLAGAGKVAREASPRGVLHKQVPMRRQVLLLLLERPRTERELREELRRSAGAIHYHLTRLEGEGRVIRGAGVPAVWRAA